MNTTINVAIVIYQGVEVIDMNGPIDVFLKANSYTDNKYRVYTVAETTADIITEGAAVRVIPAYTFDSCPPPDIIVIPGQILSAGSSFSFGSGSDVLIAWLQEQAQRTGVTFMSVCVGAYILAKTGLLANKKATTHWQAIAGIQKQYPDIDFIKNVRYISYDNFITTGGVTSGIDGALYFVEMADGSAIAQQVADVMVYNRDAPLPPDTILP